jgi:hypothetical protein
LLTADGFFSMQSGNTFDIVRVGGEPRGLDDPAWESARRVLVARYWSGEAAPAGRHAEVRALWSGEALSVRFACRQEEPLVVSPEPALERKTIGLWDRDVCEIFIAPDVSAPRRYFEFEAAPTGEWLDLAVEKTETGREADWDFRSGMTAAARVEADSVTVSIRVPWAGLGHRPKAGTRWRGNLFRCVGAGPTRGYLCWRPTYAAEPNFHVPERFGWFRFA